MPIEFEGPNGRIEAQEYRAKPAGKERQKAPKHRKQGSNHQDGNQYRWNTLARKDFRMDSRTGQDRTERWKASSEGGEDGKTGHQYGWNSTTHRSHKFCYFSEPIRLVFPTTYTRLKHRMEGSREGWIDTYPYPSPITTAGILPTLPTADTYLLISWISPGCKQPQIIIHSTTPRSTHRSHKLSHKLRYFTQPIRLVFPLHREQRSNHRSNIRDKPTSTRSTTFRKKEEQTEWNEARTDRTERQIQGTESLRKERTNQGFS